MLLLISLLSVTSLARGQGEVLLTLSKGVVFSGEPVILTCSYGVNDVLVSVTIDAFDRSYKKGSLSCELNTRQMSAFGVFSGKVSVHGCPDVNGSTRAVRLSMMASPSLELDFNCTTVVVTVDHRVVNLTSAKTSLKVDNLQIKPTPAIFNESDNASVTCETSRGKPASVLQLTISAADGEEIRAIGNGSTSLLLPLPLVNWHNAIARCIVSNRISTNIFTTSVISINHIHCTSGPRDALKEVNNGTLNCSDYVSCYPVERCSWTVFSEVGVSNSPLVNVPVFTAMHGIFCSFNCTVTNKVTEHRATVVFTMDNSLAYKTAGNYNWYVSQCYLTTLTTHESFPTLIVGATSSVSEKYWIAGSVPFGSLVIIGLVLYIAHRQRKHRRSDIISLTENDLYENRELRPGGLTAAHANINFPSFHHLLIADKEILTKFAHMILPTTVTLECSNDCEALHDVLATLIEAMKLPSAPRFKSVGLFLSSVERDVHLGQKNPTIESTENITDKGAETLTHFAHLSEMCLDQQSQSRGIDIFNYCGADAAGLADMMTNALNVTVTVTHGYGFGETKDLKKLHATSAAKYFNFTRLAETSIYT